MCTKIFNLQKFNEWKNYLMIACAFSEQEADEQAHLVDRLYNALINGIAHFIFEKKSTGELTDRYGTLKKEIWNGQLGVPEPKSQRATNPGYITFVDTEKGEWRQFTISRLKGFADKNGQLIIEIAA